MDWKWKSVTSQNLYSSNGQLVFLILLSALCVINKMFTVTKGSRSEVTLPIVL